MESGRVGLRWESLIWKMGSGQPLASQLILSFIPLWRQLYGYTPKLEIARTKNGTSAFQMHATLSKPCLFVFSIPDRMHLQRVQLTNVCLCTQGPLDQTVQCLLWPTRIPIYQYRAVVRPIFSLPFEILYPCTHCALHPLPRPLTSISSNFCLRHAPSKSHPSTLPLVISRSTSKKMEEVASSKK